MQKIDIRGWFRKFLYGIVFVFYFYILVNTLFNNKIIPNELNNFGFILISLAAFAAIIFVLYKIVEKIKITNRKVWLVGILFVAIQICFVILFPVSPQQDFGHIHELAVASAEQSTDLFNTSDTGGEYYWGDYLYYCDNNIGAALLLQLAYNVAHLVGFSNYQVVGILLNLIFIDMAVLYLYRLLSIVFNKKASFFFLLLSLTFAPFILYVPIFYSDSLSMVFGIAAIYYFYRCEYTNKRRKYDLALSAFLIGLGSCIKITVLFVGIAMLIGYLLREKRETFFTNFKRMALILVLMLVPLGFLKIYSYGAMNQSELYQKKMPFTQQLMMGLKGNGEFNNEDYGYIKSIQGKDAKTQVNLTIIQERLAQHANDNDLLSFFTDKLVHVWGNGALFATNRLEKEGYSKNLYLMFLFYAQAEWIFIIVCLILGCIFRKYLNKSQRDLQFILYVLCFGFMIFLLAWESRSRYLVNVSPLILLAGFLGAQATYNYYLKQKKCKNMTNLFRNHRRRVDSISNKGAGKERDEQE